MNSVMDFIGSFSKSGKPVRDLSRIRRLLSVLGSPQDCLRFVHIAGTNGKGSCAQMFDGIFRHAGLKTGLFTSPYLIEYSDRVRLDGENIPAAALEQHARQIKEALAPLPDRADFSQFEITMAIALLYYAAECADIVVFETGLGGTLDCTNVISTPVLTVITSISLDHTQILGDTVEQIAAHKAGIIKPAVPCVLSAHNPPEAVAVVTRTAREQRSPLIIPDADAVTVLEETLFGSTFVYQNSTYRLSMSGRHQITNALSVIEGMRALANSGIFKLSDADISAGISTATVPARVEILSREPLVILDGGHNEGGFAALAGVLKQLPEHNLTALIGMIRGKDIAHSVEKILPYVREFLCADGYYPTEVPKQTLCEMVTALGATARTADPLPEELQKQLARAKQNCTPLLICGSLYFCAHVRKVFFAIQE